MSWTVGTASGNKVVTQPTIGTAAGNKDAYEVWQGTASGNQLVFPDIAAPSGIHADTGVLTPARCTLSLYSSGYYEVYGINLGTLDSGAYCDPVGFKTNFEARVTTTSGTLTSGTTGTWQSLGTTSREWYVERDTAGLKSCSFTLEIRTGTTVVLTKSITLRATYEV